jgi:flagellar biosynthesis protein FlhG
MSTFPAPARSGRNILAVASGKGGVGKTWFAVTLAHVLSRRGVHTLLFDGDLGLANIDLQLGLMPKLDLGQVVTEGLPLESAVIPFADRFDVIAGAAGSAALAQLEQPRLMRLRDGLLALAPRYHRVVLDLGAGVDVAVRSLAAASGTVLVIATDEPTALTDAYALIKLLAAQNRGHLVRVVINMAANAREGERTYAKLLKASETFLKLSPPLAGIVRRDDRVRDAIRHQTALLTRHPTADALVDVEAIAARLLDLPLAATPATQARQGAHKPCAT